MESIALPSDFKDLLKTAKKKRQYRLGKNLCNRTCRPLQKMG